MTKKKIGIIAALAVLIIMIFPIKSQIKDGGTVKYDAVFYGVTKEHSIISDLISPTGENGYNIWTRVRILWFEVYNDVEFVPREVNK